MFLTCLTVGKGMEIAYRHEPFSLQKPLNPNPKQGCKLVDHFPFFWRSLLVEYVILNFLFSTFNTSFCKVTKGVNNLYFSPSTLNL